MSGSYDVEIVNGGEVSFGEVALSHRKHHCTTLADPPVTIPNLSGASGSLGCYHLMLPACSQNFRTSTMPGRGDADLHVVCGQRGFDDYQSYSQNNNESLQPCAHMGTWYVGVEEFETCSGLALSISDDQPDADQHGVADCVDLCPATPAATRHRTLSCRC